MSAISNSSTVASPSPLSPSLELLGEFYASGSERAFARFVAQQRAWMFDRACRVVGDATLAAEVVQDALALLARKRPRFEAELQMLAWLHRTLLFLGRNALAKERNYRKNLMLYQSQKIAEAVDKDTTEERLSGPALRALELALDGLAAVDRELLLARYFQKESWDSIARQRKSTPDAVRKRGERCLERLAKCLRAHGVLRTSLVAAALQAPAKASLPVGAELWASAALKKSATLSAAASLGHGWWMAHPVLLGCAALALVALSTVGARVSMPTSPRVAAHQASVTAKSAAPSLGGSQVTRPEALELGLKDPAEAIAWAKRNLSTVRREQFLVDLANRQLAQNPEKARAVIASMVPSGQKSLLALRYVREAAKTAPEAALAFAETELAGISQQEAKLWVAAAWLPQNPARAMALLANTPTWKEGNNASVSWVPRYRGQFRRTSGAQGASGGDVNVFPALQKALLSLPPEPLFADAEEYPRLLREEPALFKPALQAWCKQSPKAAIDWAQQHSDISWTTDGFYEFGIQTFPARAWELLGKYPETSDMLIRHTPEEVLPEFTGYGPQLQSGAATYLLYKISDANGEAALQLLKGLPHAKYATRDRFYQLTTNFPDGAYELMQAMPPGPAKEEALSGFIKGTRGKLDPTVAAELYPAAAALTEKAYRDDCLELLQETLKLNTSTPEFPTP